MFNIYYICHNSTKRNPPEHTVIIEADIQSSKRRGEDNPMTSFLRNRIISSCGDAKIMKTTDKKHIDPALCLYEGARFICVTDNSSLNEKVPRGNGTMCRFRSLKLKPDAQSCTIKSINGKLVRTVNATDVEYIECEVIDNSRHISYLENKLEKLKRKKKKNKQKIRELHMQIKLERSKKIFHMPPITCETNVRCPINSYAPEALFKATMTQFPINLADAVTGHKLQGRTLDKVIVTAWPNMAIMKNWEYTVLSRVKSRKGLYLFDKLDIHKSYAAKPEFKKFITRLRLLEDATMKSVDK